MKRLRMLPTVRQWFCVGLATLAMAGAGALLPAIQQKKAEYHLSLEPPENAPSGLIMMSTALGGFRGLLLDYLWLRAIELREEGSHYEIVQLYSWICKLEPRIAEVWSYTAHEMAYNISVSLHTAEERWRWILRGIEQLRDEGIPYNPNSARLYWELAWIFHEKLGADSYDLEHFYYQLQWAILMEEVLGEKQDIKELLAAPVRLESLLENAGTKKCYETIGGTEEDLYRAVFFLRNLPDSRRERLQGSLADPQFREAFEKLSAYIRAKRLREEYRMDPHKMQAMEDKYGDLDWRVAAAHALYWVEEELRVVQNLPAQEQRRRNIDIVRHASLTEIFEAGRVVGRTRDRLICMPNFSVLEALNELFEEIEKYRGLKYGQVSHEEFLRRAVIEYYMYNKSTKGITRELMKYCIILAKKFPHKYSEKFPDRLPQNEQEQKIFEVAVENYVTEEVGRRIAGLGSRQMVEGFIAAQLGRSYDYFYVNNQQQGYYQYCFAQTIYENYWKRHGDLSDPDRIKESQRPREWRYFKKIATEDFKKRLLQPYLFNFELQSERALHDAACREQLWQLFQKVGITLPSNATVELIGTDQWRIDGEIPLYLLLKRGHEVDVYAIRSKDDVEGEFNIVVKQYRTYFADLDE